jgi:hypothetical protein
MDGIRRRPVERLLPTAPQGPASHARRALALTRRELACLGVGACATVSSWSLAWCWW